MPGRTGIEPPSVPALAKASRLGVLADSNSVKPPGSIGRPPSPSATRSTILELFWTLSSRTSCWISMTGFPAIAAGGESNATIEAKTAANSSGARKVAGTLRARCGFARFKVMAGHKDQSRPLVTLAENLRHPVNLARTFCVENDGTDFGGIVSLHVEEWQGTLTEGRWRRVISRPNLQEQFDLSKENKK